MTPAERNMQMRKVLHPAQTCGVEVNDTGAKAPRGHVWCVRCGQVLTRKRGLSHRTFRCWSSRAMSMGAEGSMGVVTTDAPQGCQRIIVTRPRVVAPRAPRSKATMDPHRKLRDKRAAAEAMLTQWDRKLALALTKVKQYRQAVYRTTRTLEAALSGAAPLPPSKTRRIEVE